MNKKVSFNMHNIAWESRTHSSVKIAVWIFLLLSFSIPSTSQNEAELWLNYSQRNYIKKYQFWFRNDARITSELGDSERVGFMVRSRAIISLGDYFTVQPAADLRFIAEPQVSNTLEIRTWQGVSADWPKIGRFQFSHLYRFEQRFYYYHAINENDFALRSRYLLSANMPINHTTMIDRTYFLKYMVEVFLPHSNGFQETFANNIRLGIDFGYRFNLTTKIFGSVMLNHGVNTMDNDEVNNNVIFSLNWIRSLE